MRQPVDLVGQIFSRLTVIELTPERIRKRAVFRCRCECGNERRAVGRDLLDGHVKSCGCLRKATKHGLYRTRTRKVWQQMKDRCCNPNTTGFDLWGGRGIAVCDRWRESFLNFIADMGPAPEGATLERIDNEKHYNPSNCRWATRREQAQNTRRNRMVTFRGQTLCVTEWARRLGMPSGTLWARFKHGWSTERAMSTPVHSH